MTLLTVSVLTLLVLTCLQHILLFHKAINRLELQHQNFYQLETVAMQLARVDLPQLNKSCVAIQDKANKVLYQLAQGGGCSLSQGALHYRYFIEELGSFPCLIAMKEKASFATRHRRVSLLMRFADEESFLQIRYISLDSPQHCVTNKTLVKEGVSSWRYIPGL